LRVYEPGVRPGFEWVLPVHDTDHEYLWSLDGTPRHATWRPLAVSRLTVGEDGSPRAEADLPWLGGHVLVLRQSAVVELGALLERHGELLPLSCEDTDLWLFNTTTVVDALDEDRSDLVKFDDGTILAVERYEFRAAAVAPVFKVPQLLRGPLFVSDEFASALTATGLTGLELTEVWQAP
jgi:hypothetical protein